MSFEDAVIGLLMMVFPIITICVIFLISDIFDMTRKRGLHKFSSVGGNQE